MSDKLELILAVVIWLVLAVTGVVLLTVERSNVGN